MLEGKVIDGRFRIEAKAAAGGMGTVYRALDTQTGEVVALKSLVMPDDPEAVNRFQREAALLKQLSHPNIVRYVAHGAHELGWYLVMSFVDGVSLSRRLRRQGLTVDETVRVGVQVARALGALHQVGLVHRDVKPSNVMVPSQGVEPATLVDFGLVKFSIDRENLTRTGFALGSMGYMSPEQARLERNLSAAADVYSLGCVLYVCLTGKKLVPGVEVAIEGATAPPITDLNPQCPRALADVVTAMMEPSPHARPANGAACEALLSGLAPVGPTTRRPLGGTSAVSAATVRASTFVIAFRSIDGAALDPASLDALRALAAGSDASVATLRDGVVTLSAKPMPAAVDCAVAACRLALKLRALHPSAAMVAALGTGGVDDVFDRALMTLTDERAKAQGLVRLDDESARRAGNEVVLQHVGDRAYLASMRQP